MRFIRLPKLFEQKRSARKNQIFDSEIEEANKQYTPINPTSESQVSPSKYMKKQSKLFVELKQ